MLFGNSTSVLGYQGTLVSLRLPGIGVLGELKSVLGYPELGSGLDYQDSLVWQVGKSVNEFAKIYELKM